jgi:hypothetical protein
METEGLQPCVRDTSTNTHEEQMTSSQRKQNHRINPVKGDATATTRVFSLDALPVIDGLCTSLSMPSFVKKGSVPKGNIGKLVAHLYSDLDRY